MSNDENYDIYDVINELSLIIVENIYPSTFGVCIFLFFNHKNEKKDDLFDKSFFLGTGIYLTTIIYHNYFNKR